MYKYVYNLSGKMLFNPLNVVMLLYAVFQTLNLPETPTTDDERKATDQIKAMLQEMYEGGYEIEEEESLDFENSFDIPEVEVVTYEEGEENEEDDPNYYVKEMECVNDQITLEYKRNAVNYWINEDKKRSLKIVKHRFRKVTSIRQLQRWQDQIHQGGTKFEKSKQISSYTLDKFQEALNEKILIHDIDIARWALKAQEKVNAQGFTASPAWVSRFKKRHNIVSRKVTKFVTKKSIKSKEEKETESNRFIQNVKYHIQRFGLENIYNSDQSGFQLELHTGRSLAIEGTKNVVCIVQSTSAITHSYIIQPTISADGRLLSPLFIVLKEPTGTFGPRVQETMFRENNIFAMASKSGKLTSYHFEVWLRDVYFPNVGPKSVLLLDSWTGYCPDIIARTRPDSAENIVLLTIPAGTTGQRQPLDVYVFRLWKNFIKHFSDTVTLLDLGIKLYARDSILKLQSLTHYQFSSPRFRNLIKYAWHKSGYVEERPPQFETPVDFCFKKKSNKITCDICGGIAIITCAWCKKSLCIQHFFHDHHMCNMYNP